MFTLSCLVENPFTKQYEHHEVQIHVLQTEDVCRRKIGGWKGEGGLPQVAATESLLLNEQ